MKKQFTPRKRTIAIASSVAIAIVVIITSLYLILQNQQTPTSGNIYLQSKPVSFKKDAEVQVAVRITPGSPVDTVTATIDYDSSLLAYKKVVYTDSPFDSQIPATATDGSVTVQAAKLGGQTVKSDAFVGTIVFTAVRDGATRPTLSTGNAAREGEATNPKLAGKVVSSSTSDDADSASATQTTPWLAGVIGLVLAAGIVLGAVFGVKRYRKQQQQKAKQEESNHENNS